MSILKRQRKRLDKYRRKYGKFTVAARTTYGCWIYEKYPTRDAKRLWKTEALTDRQIFHDEIVIETDLSMRKMNQGW